ncbi:NADPH:quinone reductase [Cellulomonas chitinilytica]|uniref:NADPH:quinone reductase n=1 Tax=Cellulomonas chitinilytica TaxID=398759 RepID=A0A919P1P2_9CELL|nr:NAD(P)-dependent alcohol dehydrogenase [Cellulomonas chitinilytica]GIG21663.1 NADPH:quinone reductase [Cellulomonas chitinilytica]
MRAITHDRYGSPDVLRLAEVELPEPGDHDVLVRVRAASLNARDWHLLRGDPYVMRPTFGLRRPRQPVLGTDFAGTVEAVGSLVTRLRPGDEVFGEHPGAFAEYVRAPEDVVARRPAGTTFEESAAVPLAANTALTALRDVADVQPGQHVLVNGASGGVGTFAVQLAHASGARVTAVCSARNADLAASLGAEHVVDYRAHDFARDGTRYDVVYDLVGNRSLTDLRRALAPTGVLLLSGGGTSEGGSMFGPMGLFVRGQLAKPFVRQRVRIPGSAPSTGRLDTLRELVESGAVRPVVDRTYPLAGTAEAMRYLEDEHARAKVVLTV